MSEERQVRGFRRLRRRANLVSASRPADNPWLSSTSLPHDTRLAATPPLEDPNASREEAVLAPQPGHVDPPAEGPSARQVDDRGVALWLFGVHGGAGESTLAQLIPSARAAEHAWPVGGGPVVLVCRSHANGLLAARQAATQWASGQVPAQLLGLVVVADAPGALPRALRDLSKLVEGAVPRLWRIDWNESWRLGEPVSAQSAGRAVRSFLDDVARLVPSVGTVQPRAQEQGVDA